jgi:hypothetical protein
MRWTATLLVTFEMEPGQPEGLARMVMLRETATLRHAIEHGVGVAGTGVRPGSADVEIIDQGPVPLAAPDSPAGFLGGVFLMGPPDVNAAAMQVQRNSRRQKQMGRRSSPGHAREHR